MISWIMSKLRPYKTRRIIAQAAIINYCLMLRLGAATQRDTLEIYKVASEYDLIGSLTEGINQVGIEQEIINDRRNSKTGQG